VTNSKLDKTKRDSEPLDLGELDKILFPQGTEFDEDKQKLIFEHYKMLSQSSEQLSIRRQTVNGFFLSINTFLLAGIGFVFKESFEVYIHEHRMLRLMFLACACALIGIVIAINWGRLLNNYGKLLQTQTRLMEALERYTPAAVVTAQAAFHRKDLHSLSGLEKNIAYTFMAIYIAAFFAGVVLMIYNPLLQGQK